MRNSSNGERSRTRNNKIKSKEKGKPILKQKEMSSLPDCAEMNSGLRNGDCKLVGLQPDYQSFQVINLGCFKP